MIQESIFSVNSKPHPISCFSGGDSSHNLVATTLYCVYYLHCFLFLFEEKEIENI